jgi:hypothetical protein
MTAAELRAEIIYRIKKSNILPAEIAAQLPGPEDDAGCADARFDTD